MHHENCGKNREWDRCICDNWREVAEIWELLRGVERCFRRLSPANQPTHHLQICETRLSRSWRIQKNSLRRQQEPWLIDITRAIWARLLFRFITRLLFALLETFISVDIVDEAFSMFRVTLEPTCTSAYITICFPFVINIVRCKHIGRNLAETVLSENHTSESLSLYQKYGADNKIFQDYLL